MAKAKSGVNRSMQIVFKGHGRKTKRILTEQFEVWANGMKLIMEVCPYSGQLRVMEHGSLGNRLVVLPEVANIIRVGVYNGH